MCWLPILLLLAAATVPANTPGSSPPVLDFEENRGQTAAHVDFLARGPGYVAWLSPTEMVLRMRHRAPYSSDSPSASPVQDRFALLRLGLVGANADAEAHGENPQLGRANYLTLDGGQSAVRGVRRFARVRYSGVYRGVDVVYYGNAAGTLEYDFVVAAGADPGQIALRIQGADSISLDDAGNLVMQTGLGAVVQQAPVAWQSIDGERRPVPASFELAEGGVGLSLGAYDRAHDLTIDPILIYSTLLGGSGADSAEDIVVNGAGEAYVTGYTDSANFPLANALDPTHGGGRDGFLTKYNASGTTVLYSTYIGGANDQEGRGVALDGSGRIYVAGISKTTDASGDAFLLRLSTSGAALDYSRTFGGSGHDAAVDVAVTGAGVAYVAGVTNSGDLPTINAIHGHQGAADTFLARFDAAGTRDYTTYIGAVEDQIAEAIAFHEASGFAYIAGTNYRFDFNGEVFLIKLNANSVFPESGEWNRNISTGGTFGDRAYGVAVNSAGDAYVTGSAASPGFPSVNALQPRKFGHTDAFLFRVDSNNNLIFSTFLGSRYGQQGNAVALDAAGNIHVAGWTTEFDGPRDAMLWRVNAAATQVDYRAEFGHSGASNVYDEAHGVAIGPDGDAYVAGHASASAWSFVTTAGAAQAAHAGGLHDAFVARIDAAPPTVSLQADFSVAESVGLVSVTATLSAPSAIAASIDWATADAGAVAPGDYNANSGTLNFAPGQTSRGFHAFTVQNDSLDEGNEGIRINLGAPENAAIGDGEIIITIVDDDASPTLSIDNGGCTVTEGNSGSTNCNFVARLSAASGQIVTFNSAAANGTATAGADYTGHASTARSIPAGQTTLTIAVPVLGDTLDEPNETFVLNLAGIANATPGSLSATGTISDDDATPTLGIDNGGCSVTEGHSGSVNCSFVARLSAVSGRNVGFTTTTANGTATAGSDYTAHSAITRTLAAGNQTLTVLVPVHGDTLDEPNETFALNLTAVTHATPGTLSGTGTIVDDDEPVATGTLRLRDAALTVGENSGSVQIVVERVSGSGGAASVQYATANGSAIAGLDYGAASGMLNWAAGDASPKTVTLTIIFDPAAETQESFTLNLSQASGATLGTPATSTITIVDGTQMLHANGFE